ncbi:uncharacterized protein UHOD_08819 [Ustilago sp. UG-2017b]|nr:uncharacterized protein UHOD_08819 [Ustilago sp. UG-2017b]
MKPSFTILLLTLFATLAVAAPLSPEFDNKVVEDASESLSNRLSNLALHRPSPSSSQGGRPTLTIPIRPESVVVHGSIPEPSIPRASDLIRSWKKGGARGQSSNSKLREVIRSVLYKKKQSAIQNKKRPMLQRQPSLDQEQWNKFLGGGSGSGRRANSSPASAGSSMDYSRINDQDDTASSRLRP